MYIYTTVVLISSYGTAYYLALHSSLFGPDGAVNYDYIITNSTISLLLSQFGPSLVPRLFKIVEKKSLDSTVCE